MGQKEARHSLYLNSKRFSFIKTNTVNTRITEHTISEVRLIEFLFVGCLMTNQPQNVLKVFLNFYLVILSKTCC